MIIWFQKATQSTVCRTSSVETESKLSAHDVRDHGEPLISSNDEAINYLLHTYSTNVIIINADHGVSRFHQESVKVRQYAEVLISRSIRHGDVYTDYTLKSLFADCPNEKVSSNISYYLWKNSSVAFYDLVAYKTSKYSK